MPGPASPTCCGHRCRLLKHIVVDIDDDPLFGIPSALEVMGTKNIIETVTIGFLVDTDPIAARETAWVGLTKYSFPGWFSLKRVAIWIFCIRKGYDQREMAFLKLRETLFP